MVEPIKAVMFLTVGAVASCHLYLCSIQQCDERRELMKSATESSAGIVVTSYDQLRLQRDIILNVPWGYAILDEGHKIRNPDAEVVVFAKNLPLV